MHKSLVLGVMLTIATHSLVYGQDLAGGPPEESSLSQIMKTSGSLWLREWHDMKTVVTSIGNDVECQVLILRNLLSQEEGEGSVVGGVVLKVKEKYGSKSANIDADEVAGLLGTLDMIKTRGTELLAPPTPAPGTATDSSSEIQYRTKDGLLLGAYPSSGEVKYALKLSTTADWSYLSETGVSTLEANLREARDFIEETEGGA